ncbi:hypothetical protein FQR65_LT04475 [Abscondita terminalis]|nr:hypothetical protein FQR65_LT04475 [Abscondita terminalis]
MIIQRTHLEYQFNNITSHSSSYSEEELYNKYFDNEMEIYYTPSISFVDELMENVTTLVQPKKVKKFSTEEELDSYFKNVGVKKESVMGIIFELKKDDIIRKCSYILRPYKRDFTWEVDNLFDQETSNSKKSGSRSYIEQSLLAVKMAIDSTYLNMMTSNEKLTINFTVQQFPYPPHESKELIHRMQRIILYTIMFSYTILCPIVLHKVVREQRAGIRNLMKIVGVKSWMLRLGWFLNFYILNLIAIFFITFCLVVPTCCTHAPFENSNPLILFMYLLLYGAAAIMFMLALGALSTKPLFIMSMGTFVWIMSFFVPLAIMKCNPDLRWFFRFVLLLLPNGCLLFGYMDIKDYEQEDIGIRWNNMSKHARVTTNVTLGTVIIMLIVDCIFYFFLALYVENVKRGKAKSIFLPCQALFKFLCESTEYDDDSDSDDDDDDNLERTQFFCKIMEKQNKTPIKIKLRNVTKSYKRVRVVRKLSMNIKEGQITVLVGRNGSGKTTILEIISGIVSATDGAVRVMNKTNDEETIELNVGYCPQSDVLFSNLNVLEHFIIFGMLKGLDRVEAEFEANELIFRLGLHLQSHNYGASVHEGTKRKVALGLALIGNPGTLLLDDPTAGLDPESRRSVWNLLLSLKGFKTVLLTTHSMKEADVLGDQIAIIDQGGLKCFGSPSYLKSKFGNKEEEKEKEENKKRAQKILNHVLDVIPRGIFQSDDKDTLTVWIPYDSKPLLSKMFEAMEKSKTDLGIRKIDLDVTNSLEETVLRFERSLSEETVEEERIKKGSFKNNFLFTLIQFWSKTIFFSEEEILQKCVAIAILATLFTLILESKWINNFDGGPNTFYFDLHPYFKSKAYYTDSNDKNTRASAIAERYRNLVTKQDSQAIKTENVFQAILNESIGSLDSLVVAAEFNEIFEGNESRTVINALYSNNATHGAPISLNLVMNSVLQAIVNEDYSIQSAVNPFPKFRRTLKQIQFSTVITFWATLFPLGIFLFSSVFLMIPIVEKSSKSKHLQIMSGVNSITYWTTHYAWDLLIHTVMIFIIIWIVYLYGNVWYVPYNGISELGALALILAVYGVSIIPYAYLFSHKRVASVGFLTFIVINLIITFALTYHFIFPDFRHKFSKDVNLIKHIFFLYPQFGLTYASYQFSRQVDYNYNWETINATKGRKRSPETSSSADLRSYLSGQFPIGNILIIMFCSTLLYVILLTMLQTNIRRKFWDKMTNQYDDCDFSKIGRIRRYDVLWEQRRAETTYKIEKNSYKAMMPQNLQKNYKRKQVVWGLVLELSPAIVLVLLESTA